MHILIAPNAFKHSLSATAVAASIRKGIMESKLICTCECFPIGDGGDGTAGLIINKCEGKRINSKVSDPLGRTINASYGVIDRGRIAVIEMADSAGIRL
ncbi:MAG: glycerate kinase [Ferruginibacter sp.]